MPATTREKRGLQKYSAKRNFNITPEPSGSGQIDDSDTLSFVIQKHWASRLHYDFRLELDGVMLSWAVPKGPSFDPAVKSMAIQVEDHPVSYNTFEGKIPAKQYGAGDVIIWDRGTWEPVGDARKGLQVGKILFRLHGQKLAGLWELVRISKPGQKKQDQWILFKKKGDAWARPTTEYDVITALPDSVVARPLGLVEEREPRVTSRGSKEGAPDLSNAESIAKLPKALAPQLAKLTEHVPDGDWVAENKFDGYRLLARIEKGRCRLFTRNGHDWTEKLGRLAESLEAMGLVDAWIDGEIVVLDSKGVPNFNALQNAIDSSHSQAITYFVFDLPFVGDTDLRAVPLRSRRLVLQELMRERGTDRVRFSEALEAEPSQLLGAACQLGLEGLILKDPNAPYVSERSDTWLKLKCQKRQEFVVVGYTVRSGTTNAVGGLLLALHEGGELRYAGNVGTGFDSATARDLFERLSRLETDEAAVDKSSVRPGRWSRRTAGSEHWVLPEMVVEIAFAEWTPDKHVRHGTFKGVRTDKPPENITVESSTQPSKPRKTNATAPVIVTHPDRVIDPSTGLRKVDLVRYYESVADWMLPHLANRPVSLVRAPQGVTGQLFFQKHPETRVPGLGQLDPELWPGHSALLVVDSAKALVAAAQMNTIEFHTWNSTAKKIEQPDRIVFDLDPGEGVSWAELQEAALLTRTLLHELELEAWLKTSGGKGLHVVVPIQPKLKFDEVKQFSRDVVAHMARVIPQRFVSKSGPSNRKGKIFIDYLRNGHGQTTAAAFSARSRAGMGVSIPIAWEQLSDVKSGSQWTVLNAREYLSFQKDDPWASYWNSRQSLVAAVKTLTAARK